MKRMIPVKDLMTQREGKRKKRKKVKSMNPVDILGVEAEAGNIIRKKSIEDIEISKNYL